MARRDTNFYYSFVVLPEHKRRAIMAVWDFCRAVDDDVDERAGHLATEASRLAAAASVAGWRDELAACFEGRQPRTTQGVALAPHIEAFKLPRQPLEDVIDGVELDLDRPRFRTFDELHGYCLRVASAVGLVCIEIFEYTNPLCRQYAIDLGIALQLTNILRDLGRDLDAGRLYLPTEDLERFGVTEADLRAGRMTGPIRALLDFESTRARDHYRLAAQELPREDAKRFAAARIMGAIYLHLLDRIETSGYDVFGPPVRVPRWRQVTIAGSTWLSTMAGFTW